MVHKESLTDMMKRIRRLKNAKKNKPQTTQTEKSEFLALEWDHKHNGRLVGYKLKRYEELKEKYENKNNL